MIASKKIAFGTDGWRAVMAREFTFDNVALVAQAIADHVCESGKATQGVMVGYDARFLGEQFAALVADVLMANNIPTFVPDRDTPTPVIAFTIKAKTLAGAVMLTASHNPPEYNGTSSSSPTTRTPRFPKSLTRLRRESRNFRKTLRRSNPAAKPRR